MASLEELKAQMDLAGNGCGSYDVETADAVIAHLEGELTKSFETIKRCNLNMADMERDLYLKMQDVESRLAECQERERRLREALTTAKYRICCDYCPPDGSHAGLCETISAALEVKK